MIPTSIDILERYGVVRFMIDELSGFECILYYNHTSTARIKNGYGKDKEDAATTTLNGLMYLLHNKVIMVESDKINERG